MQVQFKITIPHFDFQGIAKPECKSLQLQLTYFRSVSRLTSLKELVDCGRHSHRVLKESIEPAQSPLSTLMLL